MGRATIFLLAALAIVTAMAGCSLFHHGRPSDADAGEPPLPVVPRTREEQALLELASSVKEADVPAHLASPAIYRALAPLPCQYLAVKHAPLADTLDRQRQKLQQQQAHSLWLLSHRLNKQRAFQEAMLLYSALEIRDQAAGTVLTWYYQLVGAEAKADLLNTSLELGRDTLQRIERLKKLGIPLPAPIEEYQRQVVEGHLQQAQNQLTIEQLNSKLRLAMGFDSLPPWRLRLDPGVLLGSETPPNDEDAVHLGLEQRPQLLLLRSMIANLDRSTLASARSLLQQINPLLAMSNPKPICKLFTMLDKMLQMLCGHDEEVERMRAQLSDYLRERERTVTTEIHEAVYELRARREVILLVREASERWQERIADLEKKHAQGMPVFAELTKARIESNKARGEIVKEFLGWKIAGVKLKQAQGILPAEVGYLACSEH